MQATTTANNHISPATNYRSLQYASSDTYRTAYSHARQQLSTKPISESVVLDMKLLAHDAAANIRDSSESYKDVRKICRRAVIDATREQLANEIGLVISQLDELRRNPEQVPRAKTNRDLDYAISEAFMARVNLEAATFQETLSHLKAAKTALANLSGQHVSGLR